VAMRNARRVLDSMTAHFRESGGLELVNWFFWLKNHPGGGFVGGRGGFLRSLGGDRGNCSVLEAVA
jgi:hypothetical protein